jgi:hypothetical protein
VLESGDDVGPVELWVLGWMVDVVFDWRIVGRIVVVVGI